MLQIKPIPAIVLAPLIAHPIWAVFMVASPVPIHTVGIDAIYSVISNATLAGFVMFFASAMAWLSHVEKYHGNKIGFMLMIPQQFLMLLSLWTIAVCVFTETYANNYKPPEGWRFIAADQIFFSVCALLHTFYIVNTYILRNK